MSTDRKALIGLFIILMFAATYGSLVEQFLNADVANADGQAFLIALLVTVVSSLLMMLVPFFFWSVKCERLNLKIGKRICLSNSLFMFFVPSVIGYPIIGGVGSILFYFINMWLFVGETEQDLSQTEEDGDSNFYGAPFLVSPKKISASDITTICCYNTVDALNYCRSFEKFQGNCIEYTISKAFSDTPYKKTMITGPCVMSIKLLTGLQLKNLEEVSKDEVNTEEAYISIHLLNDSMLYFKYDKSFCEIFDAPARYGF